jgi:hypothetical protein
MVKEYLQRNIDSIKVEYFPVESPEFAVEENTGDRERKNMLSDCYSNFSNVKRAAISRYYRTKRFNLNIKKYLLRSMN